MESDPDYEIVEAALEELQIEQGGVTPKQAAEAIVGALRNGHKEDDDV